MEEKQGILEDMVAMFSNIYKNKKILITGHTGFKGSWLSLWLKELGADIVGFSNSVPTKPSHFELLDLDIGSVCGDLRNFQEIKEVIDSFQPELIFHLAAQALVGHSYKNPRETYETNVLGTLNLFDACRSCNSVRGIVNVTSDKCYENSEKGNEFKETDRLGGNDVYSSSKACSEILTNSFRHSFFNISQFGKSHSTLIASARAGNVLGGGDWAENRLVPDIVRSASKKVPVEIRNPKSVRPGSMFWSRFPDI